MDSVTASDVFKFCTSHLVEIIAFVSLFVELTPVKFNPISALLGLINKSVREDIALLKEELTENINSVKSELKDDISNLKDQEQLAEEKINELVKASEMAEISRIRWEIIEFSNSIDNAQLHIRDEYRHIIDENEKYHQLIKKYDLSNGLIDEEMEKINKHYNENKNSTSVYF